MSTHLRRICCVMVWIGISVSSATGQTITNLPRTIAPLSPAGPIPGITALPQFVRQFDLIQEDIQRAAILAGPRVKKETDTVPALPAPANAQPEVVSADRRDFLVGKIKTFADYVKSEDALFTRLAISFIIVAALLALGGSI